MPEESYTIKEILSEMREENKENFEKINDHLAKLNGKVALHVQQIEELQRGANDRETRLRIVENNAIRVGVIIAAAVSLVVIAVNILVPKLFS